MAQIDGLTSQAQSAIPPATSAADAGASVTPSSHRTMSSDSLLFGGAAVGMLGLIGAGALGIHLSRSKTPQAKAPTEAILKGGAPITAPQESITASAEAAAPKPQAPTAEGPSNAPTEPTNTANVENPTAADTATAPAQHEAKPTQAETGRLVANRMAEKAQAQRNTEAHAGRADTTTAAPAASVPPAPDHSRKIGAHGFGKNGEVAPLVPRR